MISHLSLKTIKTVSPSVTLKTDTNNFEFLVIEHEKLSAAFTLHGGHLVHFQPTNQPAIIWLSKTALFTESKAIRGGVPICWPWFGAADPSLGKNLPSHGFARTSKWSLGNIFIVSFIMRCTSFIIAQRLSTVRMADKVLVLKDGKIEATGTHKQLLRESDLYAEIYQRNLR